MYPLRFRYLSQSLLLYLFIVSVERYRCARGQTTLGRTPLDEGSALRRDFYLTTHIPHYRKDIRATDLTRTRSISKRKASNRRIRPRGHQDVRPVCHVMGNVLLQCNQTPIIIVLCCNVCGAVLLPVGEGSSHLLTLPLSLRLYNQYGCIKTIFRYVPLKQPFKYESQNKRGQYSISPRAR